MEPSAIKENGELETHRSTIIPTGHVDPLINHKHDDEPEANKVNGFDSLNELIEAQKQIALLRESLNETKGR